MVGPHPRRDHRFRLYTVVGLLAAAHLLVQRSTLYQAPETAAYRNRSQEDDGLTDDDSLPWQPLPRSLKPSLVTDVQRNRTNDDWRADDPRYVTAGGNHCFVVEDMCHNANRFFYRVDPRKQQPSFRLMLPTPGEGSPHEGYRRQYSPTRLTANQTQQLGCVDDHTPNHVILYGLYNDMLGEFYARCIVGLYVLVEEEGIPIEAFRRHSRLYLHRMNLFKPLLDSHYLFTNAFRSSPLGDVLELLHDTQCRCLRRVFLCGYSVVADGAPDEPAPDLMAGTFNLTPGAVMSRGSFNVKNSKTTKIFGRVRSFLLEQTILKQPFVQSDIEVYRNATIRRLLEAAAPSSAEDLMFQEWKIIGLAQRSGRRRWRNLPEVLHALGPQMLAQGIALVEINVEEKDWTPYQQLVRHAALDGLIGIHGAQLTEAIWMKVGSLVVELLPYIPAEMPYGKWTTITCGATPLGIIFEETDLLHVGYALRRDSAPYCYNDTLDCWRNGGNPWGDRDFLVAPDLLAQLLDVFVVHRPTTCAAYGNLSQPEDRIVVYNAPCAEEDDDDYNDTAAAEPRSHRLEPRHFYWDAEYPPDQ